MPELKALIRRSYPQINTRNSDESTTINFYRKPRKTEAEADNLMPKLKTKKAILKRFKITGTKKLMCRKPGQNHFNAKESGNVTRRKRKTSELSGSARKSFKKELANL